MKKEKLTLRPGDYIVFAPGLEIKNVGSSKITFTPPEKVLYELPRDFDAGKIKNINHEY